MEKNQTKGFRFRAARSKGAVLPLFCFVSLIAALLAFCRIPKQSVLLAGDKTVYAVQIYESSGYTSAETFAKNVQLRGAAGFIAKSGDRFVVIAACYETAEEAQTVCDKLTEFSKRKTTAIVFPEVRLQCNREDAPVVAEVLSACEAVLPAVARSVGTYAEEQQTGLQEEIERLHLACDRLPQQGYEPLADVAGQLYAVLCRAEQAPSLSVLRHAYCKCVFLLQEYCSSLV